MTAFVHPTENELHAFVDDELSLSRRAEIAGILQSDPALAARVAAYQEDRDRLRIALNSIADEPLPPVWAARIEAGMATRPKPVLTRRLAVAVSLALAASVAIIAPWHWQQGDTILAEAEAARDGRVTGRLAGAQPLPPPASRDTMLRSALGMPVRAPNLQRFGFQLVGIELFGPPVGGAAQLQYLDPDRRTLTVYVRHSDGTVQFDLLRRGGLRICVWQDDVVGAVIIAPVSAAEMLRIASIAYADLNL